MILGRCSIFRIYFMHISIVISSMKMHACLCMSVSVCACLKVLGLFKSLGIVTYSRISSETGKIEVFMERVLKVLLHVLGFVSKLGNVRWNII